MKALFARRPSPALIVAVVALVVAMAGTGYAALKLPKNSVATKQIKANAVTTAKIKKEAVTSAKIKKKTIIGADINLNKLGTVPSANVANVANSLAPMEATRLVGAPGQPGFESGSGNNPGELGLKFPPAGFYKDHNGVVHLQGIVKVGVAGGTIFSLPPGYRPASGSVLIFNVFCFSETEECETDTNGDTQTYQRLLIVGSNTAVEGIVLDGRVIGRAGTTMSLDGVTFRAES